MPGFDNPDMYEHRSYGVDDEITGGDIESNEDQIDGQRICRE
jgi:hypothetical protein